MGIDLSLTSTGLAEVHNGKIGPVHRIRTSGKRGDGLGYRATRLEFIAHEVVGWVDHFWPTLVVLESPSYGSRHGSPHDRSGLWWLVVSRLRNELNCDIATVTPQGRAKYGTGKGNADKASVEAAVRARYTGVDWPATGKADDIADAVILAAMGSRHLGFPIDDPMPEANLSAMAGAAWPLVLAA